MTEEDTLKDICIRKIQENVGKILNISRGLKRQKEPRALLDEISKLAQEIQEQCLKYPLPY
jgi:hypothetical protein